MMEQTDTIPFQVSIRITHKNDQPCLEIRRLTTDPDIIKQIISSAYNQQPIVIQPVFNNYLLAINKLIEKGVITKKNEEYIFNI